MILEKQKWDVISWPKRLHAQTNCTASLIYPEGQFGTSKFFWEPRFYSEGPQEQFGTTNIPVNTFNKVWILPDDALVFEKKAILPIVLSGSHLRVMLEEVYSGFGKNMQVDGSVPMELIKPIPLHLKIVKRNCSSMKLEHVK